MIGIEILLYGVELGEAPDCNAALEACKLVRFEKRGLVLIIDITYVPYIAGRGEEEMVDGSLM